MRYLHAENADVVVLSETKVNQVPSHAGLDAMYKYRYWGIGEKKGYAGTEDPLASARPKCASLMVKQGRPRHARVNSLCHTGATAGAYRACGRRGRRV